MYEARYDATDYTSYGGITRQGYLSLLVTLVAVGSLYLFALLVYSGVPTSSQPILVAGESGALR